VLFNGFSVEVDAHNRALLATVPGVKAMYPVFEVQAPTPERGGGVAADMISAVTMTGANLAQAAGLTGAGIKVGIIDSGIDIDHPDFGGSGVNGTTPFPTARVAYGYDFVGDDYAFPAEPQPDPIPDDCGGHGTHVAGIVGANGTIKGVAPGVTFGAYRVFGCEGSTATDNILAALERAYADGMDIINQSLGAARQWPQYPTAQASNRLVEKGVIMVASIGNNGPGGSSPDGLFAAGAPGVGEKVIGVASFDNAQRAFSVNGVPYGYNQASGSPAAPTSGNLPMSKTGTTTALDDACNPLPAGSLAGTAVLVRRGTCSFYIKASNAEAAGAAAVVLYNNAAGALNPTVAGIPEITIPVVAITADQGATLDGLIAAGPTTLTWTETYVSWPYGTGGLISGFSSFGLAADLSLKPNIAAPGGGIYSTYPLEAGGFETLSGTSMSSPHVAGAAALIKQARPEISAGAMMARMQNSADPKNWSGNPGLDFLDFTHRQGAGMLDIMGTINSTTVVTPSQLSLGESQAGPAKRTLTVRNLGSSDVTYNLSHVTALATGPNNTCTATCPASYAPAGTFLAPATVAFSAPSITVPAGGSASFEVTITANSTLVDRGIYGGYVVLTPQGGGATYRVPYAGFKGDYQSTQVLTPTTNGFPWLAQLSGDTFFNRPAGATYTMAGDDIPFFLVHFDHHAQRVVLEVFKANGSPVHPVFNKTDVFDWFGRNSTPGGFFALEWNGTRMHDNGKGTPDHRKVVPNGQYVIKLSVLKALGDENNPAHWETWTSPVITVARP
jgi:minor extracellular serine protease Vpr